MPGFFSEQTWAVKRLVSSLRTSSQSAFSVPPALVAVMRYSMVVCSPMAFICHGCGRSVDKKNRTVQGPV